MKREIKFRVWCGTDWMNPDEIELGSIRLVQKNGCVFQQFTGLKDKNGKEIYEGDVVALDLYRDNSECRWLVSFESGCFAGKQIGGSVDYLRNMLEYEVIGNIYENPELLKS